MLVFQVKIIQFLDQKVIALLMIVISTTNQLPTTK